MNAGSFKLSVDPVDNVTGGKYRAMGNAAQIGTDSDEPSLVTRDPGSGEPARRPAARCGDDAVEGQDVVIG